MDDDAAADLKQSIISAVSREIAGLRSHRDAKFDEVNAKFDRLENEMDRRFTAVDQRFNRVDQRFDDLEAKVDAIADAHAETLEDHERRIGVLEHGAPQAA